MAPPPRDPNAPGELGKAVKFDNPEPETKKLIDKGWKDNAFNQYASDVSNIYLPTCVTIMCRIDELSWAMS